MGGYYREVSHVTYTMNSHPLKLLLVTPLYPPDIGGPATYAVLLEKYLPQHGFTVEVLSFGKVRSLPKVLRHLTLFWLVFRHARFADIVFAQDTVSVGLPALCAAVLRRKKFVVRVPGDYAWEQAVQRFGVSVDINTFQGRYCGVRAEFLRSIQKFVVRHADLVITPSHYFSDLVSRWISATRHVPVETIYNGVEFGSMPEWHSERAEKRVIFSAGRLVPWKGFDTLIRVVACLPEWRLRIAGEGPELAQLQSLAQELGVVDRVIFLGRLTREDVFQEVMKSRVFVLNTHFESFSYQVVEAMRIGVPVITSAIGNLAEIITHTVDGFLVTPDDAVEICRVILLLAEDSDLEQRISEEAKRKAVSFSIESSMLRLRHVLCSELSL